MANPTHRENIGRRKLNAPSHFEWFRWEVIGPDAVKLTGCVSSGPYMKGPRKGRPKYDGQRQEVVITDGEVAAEVARYEAETGLCGKCMGDGRAFASWDHITGTKWKDCHACIGTGKANATAA